MKNSILFLSSLAVFALLSFSDMPDAIVYSVPEELTPDFVEHKIDPSIQTQVHLAGQTILHVPENAFVDLDGNIVEGNVTILYKAYNNAADMAFSRIPMTYKGNNFNSSGMFEIQAQAEGEPVQIAPGKALSIDYQLAQKNPNTDFYRLNVLTNQWELVSRIPQLQDPSIPSLLDAPKPMKENVIPPIEDLQVARNYNNRNLDFDAVNNRNNLINARGNRNLNFNAPKLTKEMEQSYKTYSEVVQGLQIAKFGVYNCDQIYRLENKVELLASYKDKKGNELKDLHMLSLIDMSMNAAFSFNPSRFSCDAKANNVLLLYSESGKLYVLDKGEFTKMNINENGSYAFTVKDVSQKIKTKEDLTKYLGLS